MKKTFFSVAIVSVLALAATAAMAVPKLYINELQSSNKTTVRDNNGNYSDWIELYNDESSAVNLEGWGLSDNPANPYKFTFGAGVTIPAKGFLLVYASDTEVTTGPYLHAPYGIKSAGEPVVLTMPDGTTVDSWEAVQIDEDMSYGRKPNGSTTLGFFDAPTPGATNNNSQQYAGKLKTPLFLKSRGFYTAGFNLTLMNTTSGSTIRYTLDGSEPTESSAVYSGPIAISAPSNADDVKMTVVRVKVFKDGYLPSPIMTHSYLVGSGVFSRYNIPVVSLSTDIDNITGPNGIYTNYNNKGAEWEKPANVELFEKDGKAGFACEVGIRIHGGWTRHLGQKSIRLYADHQRGPGSFDYKVFPDSDITDYRRLILRNHGNDNEGFGYYYTNRYTLMKDGLMQGLVKDLNVETQNWRNAVVFVDGEYWGIFGIHEREDAEWIYNHHPELDREDIDMVQQDTSTLDVGEGDTVELMRYRDFINNNDLREPGNAARFKEMVDIDSFLTYYVTQLYAGNTDWPGNNIRYWRPRTEDGKWRWALADMDFSFGLVEQYNYDSIAYTTTRGGTWPNPDYNNVTFGSLMRDPELRQGLIIRLADMLNTTFAPARVQGRIDTYAAEIEPEVERHFARWRGTSPYGSNPTKAKWRQNVNDMKIFAGKRPDYLRSEACRFFTLSGTSNVTLNVSNAAAGCIKINTVTPDTYPWTGKYFNEIPITLTAVPNDGYRFVRWEGVNINGVTGTFTPFEADANITAVFEVIQ
ncbi:MAG: CotH kinase family protein [Abditibacteriota bacterium]|nr:CotH kinase family protein [Abditibacteriota bacterium]